MISDEKQQLSDTITEAVFRFITMTIHQMAEHSDAETRYNGSGYMVRISPISEEAVRRCWDIMVEAAAYVYADDRNAVLSPDELFNAILNAPVKTTTEFQETTHKFHEVWNYTLGLDPPIRPQDTLYSTVAEKAVTDDTGTRIGYSTIGTLQ